MKRLSRVIARLVLVAMTVGLLWVATNASAASSLTVDIPFAFTANHQEVPAGYYQVERMTDRFLFLTDTRTGERIMLVLMNPEKSNSIATRSELIFHVSGNHYLLTEIRFAGSNMRSRLVVQPSLAEAMAMKESGKRPYVEIAMNTTK